MHAETRRRRATAWALALALLALGAATGMAADRLLLGGLRPAGRHGPPTPAETLERLRSDLGLSDAQARTIQPLLEERASALGALFARIDPEAEAIRNRTNERVRALLEPDQRARFDARVARSERRRAELRERLERSRER